MEERTFRLLEFHKILQHLSRFAGSPPGETACLRIAPIGDAVELSRQGELLRQLQEVGVSFFSSLSPFPTLEGVFDFLGNERKILDTDGLWAVSQVLAQVDVSLRVVMEADSERYPHVKKLGASCPRPQKLSQALKRCLSPEGELRDESSPELMAVRSELRAIQKRCTKKVNEFIQEGRLATDQLQDEFLTISSDRYVLALKTNFKGKVQGIIHDYSQSGETCYFEPLFLVELNNKLQELRQEQRVAERQVLTFLTSLFRQEADRVRGAYQWLIDLDVLGAKIKMANALSGHFLSLEDQSPIDLKRSRHPLLCLSGAEVRPVDIQFRKGEKALVISGGNSGGKTVCLKTLGLITLMCLSALPVPAEADSTLPYLEKVFVFLGDEQSLSDNLSTFTAQIEHLRRVWEDIDSNTLVILDEFGAGTDPSQGAALAQAVIDGLLELDSWVGAATHFPALKSYALAKERVRAASVLFDPDTRKPLFQLAYDQVGASRALDVAREHGLPESVLKQAQEYLLLDGEDSARLLDRLNQLVVEREKELEDLHKERSRMEEERTRLKSQYAAKAEKLIAEAKKLSQQVMRDWKLEKIGRRQALKKLADTRERLGSVLQPEDEPQRAQLSLEDVATGDMVFYPAWDKQGIVREVDAKRERLKVDFGGVSVWIKTVEAAPAEGKSEPRQSSVCLSAPQEAPLHLDIRGQRTEEAGSAVVRFLDRALVQGRHAVEIIHGKGTGALRETVHEVLSGYPGVQHFDLAPEDQGGEGVTRVEL